MTAAVVHTAYDDVTVSLIPPGAEIIAVYVDGRFANEAAARARFPHARLVTITVTGRPGADFCDCETGDLTAAQAADWAHGELQSSREHPPGIYASVSAYRQVLDQLAGLHVVRSQIIIWTAHYTGRPHRCTPACGFGFNETADGTQYTDRAQGRSLDASLVTDRWFGVKPTSIRKPHGKAHFRGAIDLATGGVEVHGAPGLGRVHWGSENRWASAEIQVNEHTGRWRAHKLPVNAKPLGG